MEHANLTFRIASFFLDPVLSPLIHKELTTLLSNHFARSLTFPRSSEGREIGKTAVDSVKFRWMSIFAGVGEGIRGVTHIVSPADEKRLSVRERSFCRQPLLRVRIVRQVEAHGVP